MGHSTGYLGSIRLKTNVGLIACDGFATWRNPLFLDCSLASDREKAFAKTNQDLCDVL